MIIVGVDPGVDGGVAIFRFDAASRTEASAIDVFPMCTRPNCSGKGREIDVAALRDRIVETGEAPSLYVLELVGNIPRKGADGRPVKMGASSMFSFGDSFGLLRALPTIMGWSVLYVPPMLWQKPIFYGLRKSDAKNRASIFVQNRYPKVNLLKSARCSKNHSGMADAVCIAEYGRQHFFGCLHPVDAAKPHHSTD